MDDLKAKIEALRLFNTYNGYGKGHHAAIEKVLAIIATHAAEPAPVAVEPVAWLHQWPDGSTAGIYEFQAHAAPGVVVTPLYAHPSAAPTDNTAMVEAVSPNDARIPDHCAWAMRGFWKNAYEALLSEHLEGQGK